MAKVKKYLCMDCGEPTSGARCRPCNMRRMSKLHHHQGLLGGPGRALELAALYHGGCTLQEIGDAVGLTRERVRQLIAKVTPGGHESGWHHEDLARLSLQAEAALGIAGERWRAKCAARSSASRERLVTALRVAAQELQRTPTLGEIAARLGWCSGEYVSIRAKTLFGGTYREATRALYAMAGLEGRGRGTPGHIAPLKARTTCRRGHSLADAYVWHGRRACRTCKSLTAKARYERALSTAAALPPAGAERRSTWARSS